MPVSLQESATFTILGDCGQHLPGELEEYCCTEQLPLDTQFVQKEHFGTSRNNVMIGSVGNGDQHPSYYHRRWGCDCCVLDGFLDACRKSAVKEGIWVHFFCNSGKSYKSNLNQFPVLCHLYSDGQQIDINHCHVCKSRLL
jgi:phosphatidylinositol glycan class Q protein